VRRIAFVLVVAVGLVVPRGQAIAADLVVLTLPGGDTAGYVPPVVPADRSGTLTYVNLDIKRHNVVATEAGPDTQPWCAVFYPGKPCPVFWSELIGTGKTTPVLGLANVVTARPYEFVCTIHPGMKGTLIAVA
jgi:plastocyanin